MKYLKRFNENIEEKDLQEAIDDVLDSLSSKGSLSKSEKEFMDEASNGTVRKVTIPKTSGNFWSDMSNPHNIGIMWIGKDGVYKRLINLGEEVDSNLELSDDEKFDRKKADNINKLSNRIPELKTIINDLATDMLEYENKIDSYYNKLKSLSKDYSYQQKIEYAVEDIDGLFNQFEPIIKSVRRDLDNGGYKSNNSK